MRSTTATYVFCMYVLLLYGKYTNFSVVTISLVFSAIISAVNFSLTLVSLNVPNFAANNKKNMTTTKLSYPAKSRSTAACPSIRTAARPAAAALCSVSSSLGLVMMKYLAAEHAHTRHARNRVPGCCDSTGSVKLLTKLSFS